jgi:hypothetical protein
VNAASVGSWTIPCGEILNWSRLTRLVSMMVFAFLPHSDHFFCASRVKEFGRKWKVPRKLFRARRILNHHLRGSGQSSSNLRWGRRRSQTKAWTPRRWRRSL